MWLVRIVLMLDREKWFNRKIINAKTGSGDAKIYVYEIFVLNKNKLDYVIDLLKQRYDAIMGK